MGRVFDNFNSRWINFHESISEPVNQLTVLANDLDGSFYEKYKSAATDLQDIISIAKKNFRNIKLSGGRWSFPEIGFTKDWNIDTTNLNLSVRLYDKDIDDSCPYKSEDLIIAQCGASIKRISKRLFNRGKSLSTSGASNGQTIAGAIGTGVHGSTIEFGSIQEMVVAIHLITDDNQSIFVQRENTPIASKHLLGQINAVLVEDIDLFNTALVGLGSCGIVYGVILKVEDLFVLRDYVKDIEYKDIIKILDNSLNLDSSDFSIPKEKNNTPFHLQFFIDPYGSNKSKARVMYRKFYDEDKYKSPIDSNGNHYNPDLLTVLGNITQAIPISTHVFRSILSNQIFPKNVNGKDGILSHHFYDTSLAGSTFTCAIGLPLQNASNALKALITLIKSNRPMPCILSLRFVKGSEGLLSFTHYQNSMILEIDGVRNSLIEKFITKIPDHFQSHGISEFTFHWGKDNPLDKKLISKLYGQRFKRWEAKRDQYIPNEVQEIFCSRYSYMLGLCNDGDSLNVDPIIS